MADNKNQIGVVGRQGQPQGQPQRGIPGVAQPPIPTAEETQRVMKMQAEKLAADAKESARRAAELAKMAQPGQPIHGMELQRARTTDHQIPDDILNQMPPQMRMDPPSPVPGMSAQQVLAGPPHQTFSQSQPSGNQFERRADPDIKKPEIPWYPIRSRGISIELQDSILTCLPEKGMAGEGNAAAKVVLAVLDELLCLREQVWQLEQVVERGGNSSELMQRVYRLEMTLFEQRNSLSSQARSTREHIELLQSKGLSSEQIVQELHEQFARAEEMSNAGQVPNQNNEG